MVITEQQGMDVPLREVMDGVEVVRIPSSLERSLALQLRVAARMAWLVLRHRHASFAVVRTMTLPALAVGLLKKLRLIRFPTLVTAETGVDVAALRQLPLYADLAPAGRCARPAERAVAGQRRRPARGRLPGVEDHGDPQRHRHLARGSARRRPSGCAGSCSWAGSTPRRASSSWWTRSPACTPREPSLRLTFAGEGRARDELRARVDEHGLGDAVEFAGRVEYEELGDLFGRTDCVVLPSYSEGMPLSILEAAAHHRVLVVSDVGDIRRLFGDRIHICPIRDADGLAAVLERVVRDAPRTDYAEIVESVSIETVAETMLSTLGAPTTGARATT